MNEVEQILIGIDLGTSRTALMTNLGAKKIAGISCWLSKRFDRGKIAWCP